MDRLIKNKLAMGIALAAAISLVGCGGESSTDSALPASTATATTATTTVTVPGPLEVGTFVDSPVDGLTYQGTYSGITSSGGRYDYAQGGQVSFLIGDQIRLGRLTGRLDRVSPLDFFEGADTTDQRIKNILVLLQSLDSDGIRKNGITITEEAVAALEVALADAGFDLDNLDLSEMTIQEAQVLAAQLPAILAAVIAETSSPDDVVVTEEEAEVHFQEVMSGDITVHKNISRTPGAGSGGQSVTSMMIRVDSTSAAGEVDDTVQVRPLLISYTDIMMGDFLMGTGSSEIPDIEHIADVFVALSLDKGESWKSVNVSRTAEKSSIDVDFHGDGNKVAYNGHSFKPVIKTEADKVLLAWNDKYCPSGNPLNLENTGVDGETLYAEDLYLVNGPQGTIDYKGEETFADDIVPAHEVPFSCIMTVRGVYNADAHTIDWHTPMQLTSGRRDSNKLAIDSSAEGFVLTWQEDPEGLRPGGGSGPGDGWSGASTNHQADIWYSYLPMSEFEATDGVEVVDDTTKPKSLNNLSYPVPITDNAVCQAANVDTGAQYCVALCEDNGAFSEADHNDDGKCYSGHIDPILGAVGHMDPIVGIYAEEDDNIDVEPQLLNGDTGASRAIIGLFGRQVILGYEETKGEADNLPGVPNSGTQDSIPLEKQGKIAYVHTFDMEAPASEIAIAPGMIVNQLKPREDDGKPVLENARRLTLIRQVDETEATPEDYLWGILYKSGAETKGGSSDMYLSLADGFALSDLSKNSLNMSARTAGADETIKGTWDQTNMDDASWENSWENTFSPRGFLRGSSIYVGYEYTQSWRVTSQGHLPNDFHLISSFDRGLTWNAPINISNVPNNLISTLDPRLIPTSEPIAGVETPAPDTLFISYGTFEMGTGIETDLFMTRSIDAGLTWDKVPANSDGSDTNEAIVNSAAEEKEVQNIASPDGRSLYTVWLQELDPEEAEEGTASYLLGSDIWAQRKDYPAEEEVENDE
ncbi:MAG: choice-of-anchor O protein [Pontibacterium sp.]